MPMSCPATAFCGARDAIYSRCSQSSVLPGTRISHCGLICFRFIKDARRTKARSWRGLKLRPHTNILPKAAIRPRHGPFNPYVYYHYLPGSDSLCLADFCHSKSQKSGVDGCEQPWVMPPVNGRIAASIGDRKGIKELHVRRVARRCRDRFCTLCARVAFVHEGGHAILLRDIVPSPAAFLHAK